MAALHFCRHCGLWHDPAKTECPTPEWWGPQFPPTVKRTPLYVMWPDTRIKGIESSMIKCPQGHRITEWSRN